MFLYVPGNTTKVIMKIETAKSPPFREAPFSVPLGLREEVKQELGSLKVCRVISKMWWAVGVNLAAGEEGVWGSEVMCRLQAIEHQSFRD